MTTDLSSMLVTGAQLLLSAGVVGLITTLLTIRSNRRSLATQVEKNEADAADVLTGTALRLLPPLEAQVKHFQLQVQEMQKEVSSMKAEVARLTGLLQEQSAASSARIAELTTERDDLRSQVLAFTRKRSG